MIIDTITLALTPILHEIKRTAIVQSLFNGTMDRGDYAITLAQLNLLHAALESGLELSKSAIYRPEGMGRAYAIERDLESLGYLNLYEPFEPTARLAEQIIDWSEHAPWKLIGILFVFESSRLGHMDLVRPIANAIGVDVRPDSGLDYLLEGIATRPMAWGRFKAELIAENFSDEQSRDICLAAIETMSCMLDLFKSVSILCEESQSIEV